VEPGLQRSETHTTITTTNNTTQRGSFYFHAFDSKNQNKQKKQKPDTLKNVGGEEGKAVIENLGGAKTARWCPSYSP
jgi:hypothetical protein